MLVEYSDVVSIINKDLPEDLRPLAKAVLDYLVINVEENSSSMSYGSLRNIVNKGSKNTAIDKNILSVIHYFTGDALHLLNPIFHYFDDQIDQYFPISKKEISLAYKNGFLKHPITDENIEDFQNFIVISYSSSDFVRRIVR